MKRCCHRVYCASESGIEQTADARHAYFCQCPSTSVDRRLRNPEPRLDAPRTGGVRHPSADKSLTRSGADLKKPGMVRVSAFIEPCLPSRADRPPSGPGWVHEIKHDGFRLMVRRDSAGIRRDNAVFLYAFDLLELDGVDLRRNPIEVRKEALANLLHSKSEVGLQLNEHFHEAGDVIFRHACKLGLEGIVSKRKGSPYRSGRSPDWLKMKNPDAPAVKREAEEEWDRK